ncbi:MAG: protein jag [Lachnospiraceae bacterium]|nr:protein jag [Lachnospiraceae bacterium]
MEFQEFSAKTVSDCITEACTTLGVPSDRLVYEVVTEGSTGFIGIGAKPAIIKARVKSEEEMVAAVEEEAISQKAALEAEKIAMEAKNEVVDEKAFEAKKEAIDAKVTEATAPKETGRGGKVLTDEEIEEVKAAADKFLKDVFASMQMEVEVTSEFARLDNTLSIDLAGDDMGVLIGRRGQTLDSLQYLVSLVVNKGTHEYIRVKVDTENYRKRRKDTLENLAKNQAYKVKSTRRSVVLEPMNPYERRIIHSALQNDNYVTTHSEGEEPYRKVVITLKK